MVFTLFRGRSQFAQIRLTHLFPMHPFSIPWYSQCTLSLSPYDFLMFSGGREGCVWNKWVNMRSEI